MLHHSPEFLDLQAALAGEYSLQRELGRGGMGIVYLARDVQLDRDVAIKVLPPHLASDAASRQRFLREARTAAGLSHPHIVPIHRVGEVSLPTDGRDAGARFVFFVMSYIEGQTLGDRLRARGPLPPDDAARVLREVAWALAYAHGRGIVHRDVKPDNILLEAETGRALVTDFGIAQSSRNLEVPGDTEKVMGTAFFMSPEQAAGATMDARSDLYALGVVGHLAVSGRLPYDAKSHAAHLVRQATAAPATVLRSAPGLSPTLAAAIDRCLAPEPGDRFPDGEMLAAALAPVPVTKPTVSPSLRAWLSTRNSLLAPYFAWSGVFGFVTLANLVAWLTGNRPDGPADILLLAGITSLPLFPIVGFHLNQARRQFRAGHTLADLRTALDIAQREQAETDMVALEDKEALAHRLLRFATVGSASWLAVTFGLVLRGSMMNDPVGVVWFLAPVFTTMLLGALSNALDVQFIPERLRQWWQTGVRDRLWNSRAGEWFARRLGAPERSRAIDGGAFRATEAALGVAAGALFEALPRAHREQLSELPAIVAAMEARAAEARAELELVAALAPQHSADRDSLHDRHEAAASRLADSVAALEGIRLDLLRLHGGTSDLAPFTTLMDAAKLLQEDVERLAEAHREVEDVLGSRA